MRFEMPPSERLEIASSLDDYHSVFYTFFSLASASFTDELPTAAVRFPRDGGPADLLINHGFWQALTHRERLFVICHECLHVLLNHGLRNGMDVPGATPYLVNVAQDITINEMIIDLFNYDRLDIRGWENYCWIDTCFDHPILVKRNETFIYYLEKLITDKKITEDTGPSTLDEHGAPGHGDPADESEATKRAKEELAEQLAEELTPSEIESILKSLPDAGTGSIRGAYEHVMAKKVKRLKIKFSHIIRKLKKTAIKESFVDVETFSHTSRRFDDMMMRCPDLNLPGKVERGTPKKDKLLTAVFMDVSGSCIKYLSTFESVITAFGREPDIFDVRMFIFDTMISEVKPGDRVRVGGGTSFKIIEQRCQRLAAEGRYPDCVVVITDGYGDTVAPAAPTKWVWLLTQDATKEHISRESLAIPISNITF